MTVPKKSVGGAALPAEHAPPDTLVVLVPQEIAPASWLNEPGYESFRKALAYAETQTRAIPALAKCSPEELYCAYTALLRGAGFVADALEGAARPALAERGDRLELSELVGIWKRMRMINDDGPNDALAVRVREVLDDYKLVRAAEAPQDG